MGGYNEDRVGSDDKETSEEASSVVTPTKRQLVYDALFSAGPTGLADYETEEITAYKNAGQRRRELVRDGRIREKLGVKRKSPQGKDQIVWSAFDDQDNPLHSPCGSQSTPNATSGSRTTGWLRSQTPSWGEG